MYKKNKVDDWEKIPVDSNGDTAGRTIDPIPWEGDKHFFVKITEEELESLKDERGEIQFEIVLRWTLPTYTNFKLSLYLSNWFLLTF